MSTTALTGYCPTDVCGRSVMPRRNGDVRKIVREEIEHQKKLDEIERKYEAGEISKFEYRLSKLVLTMPSEPPVVYSQPTIEYMA